MPNIGKKEYPYSADGIVLARGEAMKIVNSKASTAKEKAEAKLVLDKYAEDMGDKKIPEPAPRPKKPKSKKPEMMKGGMANKKVHMYATGGMVKDYN